MKLISICIPTYNRNEELRNLYINFLKKIEIKFLDDVELVVCDNSDDDLAIVNASIFSKNVKYIKNESNLGFAKNVLKCYEQASSKYIWIISDNDDIFIENLIEVINYLKVTDNDCVLLPFRTTDLFDKEKIVSLPNVNSLNELYEKDIVPFILLSSAIVKKNAKDFEKIKNTLGDNDFVQIALFSIALHGSQKIHNYDKPIINYYIEYNGRFSPFKTYTSMNKVMIFLSEYFHINVNNINKKEFNSLIRSTFLDDSGIYRIMDIENVRKKIVLESKRYPSIKVTFLLFLFHLPQVLRKNIYLFYSIFKSVGFTINIFKYISSYINITNKFKN